MRQGDALSQSFKDRTKSRQLTSPLSLVSPLQLVCLVTRARRAATTAADTAAAAASVDEFTRAAVGVLAVPSPRATCVEASSAAGEEPLAAATLLAAAVAASSLPVLISASAVAMKPKRCNRASNSNGSTVSLPSTCARMPSAAMADCSLPALLTTFWSFNHSAFAVFSVADAS